MIVCIWLKYVFKTFCSLFTPLAFASMSLLFTFTKYKYFMVMCLSTYMHTMYIVFILWDREQKEKEIAKKKHKEAMIF